MIPDLDRVENIVGKGENAGYQHFLIFPQCFQIDLMHLRDALYQGSDHITVNLKQSNFVL